MHRTQAISLAAAAAVAAIAGAANAALYTLPDIEAQNTEPKAVFLNDPFLDGEPVKFGPVANFTQSIFNGSGLDWIAVQFRVIPDPNETYAPGEFENIFFDTNTAPTINGQPAPGGIKDFDLLYLEDNQLIRFVFDNDAHNFLQSLQYKFTILNENDREIGYGIQVAFFPVPTPGATALLAVAGIGMATRRRR
ncbi:MAG: hypothetical protein ACTS3F_03780 [Phycisphaerales bacterium]